MTTPTYDELVSQNRIVLTYKDNPNGSRGDIAGIANEGGNVVGLMPHPERAMSTLLGQRGRTRPARELRRDLSGHPLALEQALRPGSFGA